MNSGPVVAMAWEGQGAVKTGRLEQVEKIVSIIILTVRVMLGETNPAASKPGTIRGDYCIQVENCIFLCMSPFMTMTLRLDVTSATEVTLLNLQSMRSSCGSGKSTAPFHFWLFLHLLHILGTKTSATGPLPRKTGSLETTRRSMVRI